METDHESMGAQGWLACATSLLSAASQIQRPKLQPRAPDKPGEGESGSICKFNFPHQVLNLFTLQI